MGAEHDQTTPTARHAPEEPAMTPQHTGATTHDLTTWDAADFETSQVFAATNPAAAIPGAPVPPPDPQDTAHRLAA